MCMQWRTKKLSESQKALSMGKLLQHLFYHEDPAFLEQIVTRDENWSYEFDLEIKQDSMQ